MDRGWDGLSGCVQRGSGTDYCPVTVSNPTRVSPPFLESDKAKRFPHSRPPQLAPHFTAAMHDTGSLQPGEEARLQLPVWVRMKERMGCFSVGAEREAVNALPKRDEAY